MIAKASIVITVPRKYALGRRFFVTEKQYFGLAPPQAEPGAKRAFFSGYAVPLCEERAIGIASLTKRMYKVL